MDSVHLQAQAATDRGLLLPRGYSEIMRDGCSGSSAAGDRFSPHCFIRLRNVLAVFPSAQPRHRHLRYPICQCEGLQNVPAFEFFEVDLPPIRYTRANVRCQNTMIRHDS